jgi:hypothetical protein
VLKDGGRVLIIDMQEHTRKEYKHTMGHIHLGFSENDIKTLATSAGLKLLTHHRLRPETASSGPSLFAALLG